MKKQIVFFMLIIAAFCGCANKANNSIVNEVISIKDDFSPIYNIVNTEDITYKDKGVKVNRILYRITFPRGLSSTDIYDNFRYLTKKTYKEKGIKNISIYAYYSGDDVNDVYTIGMFEMDLAHDEKPNLVIAKSYFEKPKLLISKGSVVLLNTKEEYDRSAKKFVSTKRTKLYTLPDDLRQWDYVTNGTKATVIEVYSKRLTADYTSIAYKVEVPKGHKQGWVLEDYVSVVK